MDSQMVLVLDGWNQDDERQREVTCFGDEGRGAENISLE